LGSCFVENIGKKLEYFKFRNSLNPFGILFHPAAIREFLENVRSKKRFSEEDIFYHNETWSATHVIITPGTAWGYRFLETGKVVANCHKVPQKNFSKELLEVKEDLLTCVEIIKELNPSAAIIFTVSPVRHLKEGFVENQQSKAKLISAIHEIVAERSITEYFPSYEIMMDELRDYRFYAEDMVHPNEVAIDYIWERFRETLISSEAWPLMKKIDSIQKGLSHRPFNEASAAHQKFRANLQQKIEEVETGHPQIRF
jgi:hypothetical protein